MGVVVALVAAVVLLSAWLATATPLAKEPGPRARVAPTRRTWRDPWPWSGPGGARWARRADLRSLVVPAPQAGRLTVGVSCGRLVAVDAGHSLLVVGPTQSFKTTGLAVPALLEWQGPVVAASVKGDLVHDTVAWRRRQGTVWIYDPTGSTDLDTARWSPLTAVTTYSVARRVADGLVEAGRSAPGGLTDGDFW